LSPAVAAEDDAESSTNREIRPIEELFMTDTVYPQEKGELEIALLPVYQNNAQGDTWTTPVSVEYGLTSRWQVEGEWDAYRERLPHNGPAVGGVGDLELGTQYSFLNLGQSLFHLAPRFSLTLPLGSVNKGLSEGFLKYQPALVLARDMPTWHHTQLFTEIGLGLVQRLKRPADADDAKPAAHELDWGAGFFTLLPQGAFTLEFNLANNRWNHHGEEDDLYVTPGWLWHPFKHTEVGLGVPVGLNRQSDRYDLIAHIVYEF
jgi:hypothetical protein